MFGPKTYWVCLRSHHWTLDWHGSPGMWTLDSGLSACPHTRTWHQLGSPQTWTLDRPWFSLDHCCFILNWFSFSQTRSLDSGPTRFSTDQTWTLDWGLTEFSWDSGLTENLLSDQTLGQTRSTSHQDSGLTALSLVCQARLLAALWLVDPSPVCKPDQKLLIGKDFTRYRIIIICLQRIQPQQDTWVGLGETDWFISDPWFFFFVFFLNFHLILIWICWKKKRVSEFLTKFHCLHQWMEMELCCHGDGLASVTWFNFVKKKYTCSFFFFSKCFFKPVCQNKTKLWRAAFAFILTDRSFADQQGSTRTNARFLSGCDGQTVGPPVATVTLLCLFPSF